MEIVIDAENAIAGRVASYAAKQTLLRNSVSIVNSEKAVITGSKENVLEKYSYKIRILGQPSKGPFIQRMPDRFLRRIVRGMLPHKKPRGADAYRRVLCYIGVPGKFKSREMIKVPGADIKKLTTAKFIYLGRLCKLLGAKV